MHWEFEKEMDFFGYWGRQRCFSTKKFRLHFFHRERDKINIIFSLIYYFFSHPGTLRHRQTININIHFFDTDFFLLLYLLWLHQSSHNILPNVQILVSFSIFMFCSSVSSSIVLASSSMIFVSQFVRHVHHFILIFWTASTSGLTSAQVQWVIWSTIGFTWRWDIGRWRWRCCSSLMDLIPCHISSFRSWRADVQIWILVISIFVVHAGINLSLTGVWWRSWRNLYGASRGGRCSRGKSSHWTRRPCSLLLMLLSWIKMVSVDVFQSRAGWFCRRSWTGHANHGRRWHHNLWWWWWGQRPSVVKTTNE